jgi:type II secretory pathway component GspD/PulD (secretin)
MMQQCSEDGGQRRSSAWVLGLVVALAMLAGSAAVWAQADASGQASVYETLYLSCAASNHASFDIVTDLRNMFPRAKIYFVPSENAISMMATADEYQLARRIVADLDHPTKSYRLTYTITETGGQTRRASLVVALGETAWLKQGTRVPVVTGTSGAGNAAEKDEVQYIDVGLNVKAALSGSGEHLRLDSRIEQSVVAEEKSGVGADDPVIRQTALDGTMTLTPGATVTLGSLDLPDGKGRVQIAVTAEPAG